MEVLASSDELELHGFLCPGHVSVILGPEIYAPLADKHRLACAIAGFEPLEILRGLASLVDQVAKDKPRVDNCYPGAVRPGGNPRARAMLEEVFEPCDSTWRGVGPIPHSGLDIRAGLADFDAEFHVLQPTKLFAQYLLPEPVPGCYANPQKLAQQLLSEHQSNGILYPSVRRKGHRCLVCFRPALVYRPRRETRLEITFTATEDGYRHRIRRLRLP
jgi:hypothetical protein